MARLCNRWRQVNAFDAFPREAWRTHPGRAQFYVVHGEEGAAHGSLVDRLAHTRLRRFADQVAPGGRGHLVRIQPPWPRGLDPGVLARDLAIGLFREVAPAYMGDDLRADRLLTLPALPPAAVLMMEHTVHARYWSRGAAELLRWYCHEFLGAREAPVDVRQVVVFVKITYTTRGSGLLSLLRARWRRRAIHADLDRVLGGEIGDPHGLVLEELGKVTLEDVKDWFVKNRIYDSEETQVRLAESVLAGRTSRGLAAVEEALEEIHGTFVTELASERGGLS